MGTKLYVGNLPFSVTDEDLRSMFSSFGEITEAVLIKDKFSGRSKGFGFVTYTDEESANKAISEMNGKEVQGRELKVTEAKPIDPDRPRPPRRDFGGGRGFGGRGRFDRRERRDY
ncbi:MAG: RNA-binding protein [Nanoarchaeota archaeon]